jgi:LacI family transcriptional regulator
MVTIKTIAKRAKVSIGTVDRILHNRGNVSPKTAKRVRQALKELNYKPNVQARNLKLQKTFNFGVLMPLIEQDSGYWAMPYQGIEKAKNELKAHKVHVTHFFYDRYSHISFANACQQVLDSDLDGLLIAPVMSSVSKEFIKKIPSDLPYIFFDSIVSEAKCLTSIVQDSFLSGRLAAKLMKMLINEPGTIAAIRVLPEDYHINERIRGFQSYFLENTDIQISVHNAERKQTGANIQNVLEKVLEEHKDLRGIFVSNALTYRVAEFVEKHGIKDKIKIIGYDLIAENIHYLKKDYVDFLISQQPERQGYQGIMALYTHLVLQEPVGREMMMPLDVITKENVDFYLN